MADLLGIIFEKLNRIDVLEKKVADLERQLAEQPKQMQIKTICIDNPDINLLIEHHNNLVTFINEAIVPVLRVLALEQIQSCEQVSQNPASEQIKAKS